MKKRSLALSLLALTLSLASCSAIDDSAEKEEARQLVSQFTTTEKVSYTATISGQIRGTLWNSDNDGESIVTARVGTAYLDYQNWEDEHSGKKALAADEAVEDSSDTGEDAGDGETSDPDTNPYIDAKAEEVSAVLHVPNMITSESFDLAYDGMTDGSLFGALANNSTGVLQCEPTQDGGVEFFVKNYSYTCWIYGISTGGYSGTSYRADRPFKVTARWNISVVYSADGVIESEDLSVVRSHSNDPEGTADIHVDYTFDTASGD